MPSKCEFSNYESIYTRYLAPEYADGGHITHKVDVYAFGVVLLELMTGKRIDELQYIKGQKFLSEWFHPLAAFEPGHIIANNYELLDPRLACEQSLDISNQLEAMGRAASFCLHRDPECRPPMSKVAYLTFFIPNFFLQCLAKNLRVNLLVHSLKKQVVWTQNICICCRF